MAATTAAVAAAGATAYSARKSAKAQAGAAEDASAAQTEASEAGIEERRRQFDKVVELLSPFVTAGTGALGQQEAILGLKGQQAQQAAIAGFEQSPLFQSMVKQQENSILQNAAATGGLRGGNIQAALSQFRPQLLDQLVQRQFSNLGGLTQLGQASAAGTASAAQQTGSGIADLLAQRGAAQAGGYLAAGKVAGDTAGNIAQGIGLLGSLGGFGAGSASTYKGAFGF